MNEFGTAVLEITIAQVSEAEFYADPDGYFGDVPEPGNVYLQAFAVYEALADGASFNQFDWQVFVDGVALNSTSAFVLNGPEPELGSGTLPAGRRAEGWLVFEVPAAGEVVLSYEQNFIGGGAPPFELVLRQ